MRRNQIMDMISRSGTPISASSLAASLNVSRQVIVGDVALLRAQGNDIIATARGYMLPGKIEANHKYIGKIACRHSPEKTKPELYLIVDLGAVVVDVIIEHDIYGEITGSLNLASRSDVDEFTRRVDSAEIKLLSELTMGTHLHTVACRDKAHFGQVVTAMEKGGYLYQN